MSERLKKQPVIPLCCNSNSAEVIVSSDNASAIRDGLLPGENSAIVYHASFRRTTGLRVLALLLALGGVTLGMLIGLLFMASDCEPTRMMDTMSSLSRYISSHKLIIGGSAITALGIYMAGTSTKLPRLSFGRVFGLSPFSPCADLAPSAPTWDAVESQSEAKNVSLVHQETIEHIVMQIVAETIEVPIEQIHRTGDFFEYGADSYSLNKVLSLIEQRLQVQLKADDIFDHSMLSQLAALITQQQQQEK